MMSIANSIDIDEYKIEYIETLKACTESCKPYCKEYIEKYLEIKYSGDCYWLTFSPKPHEADPYDLYCHYLNEYIIELCKVGKLICVSEYASERLHFHIVIQVDDYIKYNRLVNKMKSDYMAESYVGVPKNGIHYLFKDVKEALKRLKEEKNVINTEATLLKIKEDKKAKRKIERQEELLRKRKERVEQMKYKVEIPQWMLKDKHNYDSE